MALLNPSWDHSIKKGRSWIPDQSREWQKGKGTRSKVKSRKTSDWDKEQGKSSLLESCVCGID